MSTILLCSISGSVLFIITSWAIAKSGKMENNIFRVLLILAGITFVGAMVFVLPFLPQPRWGNIYLRLIAGIPVAMLGMTLRIYPLIYFRKMKIGPDLVKPSNLITTGAYGIVRHPQYVAGTVFIIGWFLIWGGIYSLYVMPAIIIAILFQAYMKKNISWRRHLETNI